MAMGRRKRKGKIIADRHMRKQQRVLIHQANAPVLGIKGADQTSVQQDIAGGMYSAAGGATDDGQQG